MQRNDGRGLDKIRKVTITRNYIKYADGSCLIEMGNTKVICTASVDENVPPFLKGSGTGWVTAEYGMLPRSCQTRIKRGKDSGRTYEIQRLVGRSLRAVTDMRLMGERTVWIDCDVIQADGGTRTASITGAYVALAQARHRWLKQGVISSDLIRDSVAAVSVGVVDGRVLLDLTYAEDSRAAVDMNFVMTGAGKFVEVQGTAESDPFTKKRLDKMAELAGQGIRDLLRVQKKVLAQIKS